MLSDIFVDLLTLEAQAYGPDALHGIRVVETAVRAPAGPPSSLPQSTPGPPQVFNRGAPPLGGASSAVGSAGRMGPPSAPRRAPVVLLPKPAAPPVVVGGGGGQQEVRGRIRLEVGTVLPPPIRASALLSPPQSSQSSLSFCNN